MSDNNNIIRCNEVLLFLCQCLNIELFRSDPDKKHYLDINKNPDRTPRLGLIPHVIYLFFDHHPTFFWCQ